MPTSTSGGLCLGLQHKRARPPMLCANILYDFCGRSDSEVELLSSGSDPSSVGGQLLQFSLAKSKEVPDLFSRESSNLVRSKSFPPEGWPATRCFLPRNKTSRATVAEAPPAIPAAVTAQLDSYCHATIAETPLAIPAVIAAQADACQELRTEKGPDVHVQEADVQSYSLKPKLPKDTVASSFAQIVHDCPNKSTPMEQTGGDSVSCQRLTSSATAAAAEAMTDLMTPRADLPAQVDEVVSTGVVSRAELGNCPPSGKLLVCGRRREMEDCAVIVPSFAKISYAKGADCSCDSSIESSNSSDLHFFAVYDGHGGSQASNYCEERLHHVLAEELERAFLAGSFQQDNKWKNIMTSCFSKMDREVGGICPYGECDYVDSSATCCEDAIAPDNVGTTAVVAVVSSSEIIIANCGDSRAVLSRGGKAIPLSRDHKPDRDDETNRIEAAGGQVIYWDGYRVGGLLALSRAIGDRFLKRYVVSDPEVMCLQRCEEDECLILASDGLWDVISNDTACEVARKSLANARRKCQSGNTSPAEDPALVSVAALLVKLAYGRGSKDNISVVVVDLKPRQK